MHKNLREAILSASITNPFDGLGVPDGSPDGDLYEWEHVGNIESATISRGSRNAFQGIDFGHNVQWGAINQRHRKRLAEINDGSLPRWLRVQYAAEGYANRIGHAEFSPGQLGMILGTTKQGVHTAIKEAKRRGLVADISGARCLVLSDGHFQKAGKGTTFCRHHDV
ncbi:MarR family transcriptional regulator [Actinoplanes sp. NPDC048988]|uniref:MarR family transcriptional regulator n=1 Tax=Actinoplanes sp. NPDC048988 TaxID=3363901 RepID=UPI0037167A33